MKRFKRVLALTIIMLFVFSTSVLAAIPSETVITVTNDASVGKAYALDIIGSNADAVDAILNALDNGEIYVKLDDESIFDLNGNSVDKSEIPEVVYTDGNVTERYAAGDGEKITDGELTLSIEIDDEDKTLIADGADNAILTVKALKDGKVDETFEGSVKFVSLKGAAFAKEVVSFDKGIATVQLTSISSAVAIQDTIIAIISDSTDEKAIGTRAEINVSYIPVSAGDDIDEKVFITYAESDRASDVYVQFNKEFDFDKLYEEWEDDKDILKVNGNNVTDLVKVDDKTVKLVLDESKALTDNSTITITADDRGRTESILIDSEVTFKLVDLKAPEAVGVDTPDYKTIIAKFTEPVSATTAEIADNWVLNGKQLGSSDVIEIKVGKDIDNNGTVDPDEVYVADKDNPIDNRAYVTIKLSSDGVNKLKAAGKMNLLQAYNMIDYAGLTDTTDQNKANTQEFTFVTPQLPDAPVVEKIVVDSPEQFRIIFNEDVQQLDDSAVDSSNFKMYYSDGLDGNGNIKWVELTLEDTYSNDANVLVTQISESEYLFELQEDWRKKHNTATTKQNYYTPNFNQVKFVVLKADIENLMEIQMAEDYEKVIELELDDVSPEIEDAYQVYVNDEPQQKFFVRMTEPVQMPQAANNTAKWTPSDLQTNGIPTPTFEFVNEDGSVTVDGTLESDRINETDTEFYIVPDETLAAGEWTLYIRSISDDVGNTSATVSYPLTVEAAVPVTGEPVIIWADVHDNVDFDNDGVADADIVHIQFGTEMSMDVWKSNVYTINGKVLPVGTKITSDEVAYYDSNGDGNIDDSDIKGTRVEIVLPIEFLGDIDETIVDDDPANYDSDQDEPHILNISKSLTDAEGNQIEAPTEVEMTYVKSGYTLSH